MNPLISVVLPVRNGRRFVGQAVQSILAQDFKNLELIVVNDGSTDDTADILSALKDSRLRVLTNERPLNIPISLNRAVAVARGAYLARMDGDDISLPRRLSRQFEFMESHPDVGMCGTWATIIDANEVVRGERRTPVGRELRRDFWRPSPIIGPSALFRRFPGLSFDEKVSTVEDYEFCFQVKRRSQLANIPELLLLYRQHEGSVTVKGREQQLPVSHEVFCRHTGATISYEVFCDLIFDVKSMHPRTRMRAHMEIARGIGLSYLHFAWGDLRHLRRWLRGRRTRDGGLPGATRQPGEGQGA